MHPKPTVENYLITISTLGLFYREIIVQKSIRTSYAREIASTEGFQGYFSLEASFGGTELISCENCSCELPRSSNIQKTARLQEDEIATTTARADGYIMFGTNIRIWKNRL